MNFVDRPSMKNSPVFSPKNQKRLWLQLAVILVVIAVTALKPRFETWLNPVGPDASAPPDTSVAEAGPPDTEVQSSENSSAAATESSGTESSPTTPPDSENQPLGKLTDIGGNVFESTAGLRYKPGSADGHRTDHVMEHAEDQPDKRVHGVFDGGRSKVFAVIDEAWLKAKKGGRDVRTEKQNNRTVFTVRMNRRVGYVGGQEGETQDHPECRSVRIVVEGTSDVITAYPTK